MPELTFNPEKLNVLASGTHQSVECACTTSERELRTEWAKTDSFQNTPRSRFTCTRIRHHLTRNPTSTRPQPSPRSTAVKNHTPEHQVPTGHSQNIMRTTQVYNPTKMHPISRAAGNCCCTQPRAACPSQSVTVSFDTSSPRRHLVHALCSGSTWHAPCWVL